MYRVANLPAKPKAILPVSFSARCHSAQQALGFFNPRESPPVITFQFAVLDASPVHVNDVSGRLGVFIALIRGNKIWRTFDAPLCAMPCINSLTCKGRVAGGKNI
jgi:hypothetical protein